MTFNLENPSIHLDRDFGTREAVYLKETSLLEPDIPILIEIVSKLDGIQDAQRHSFR